MEQYFNVLHCSKYASRKHGAKPNSFTEYPSLLVQRFLSNFYASMLPGNSKPGKNTISQTSTATSSRFLEDFLN